MHPKVSKSAYRDNIFIDTLFTVAKILNQLTSIPVDVWKKKMDYLYYFYHFT